MVSFRAKNGWMIWLAGAGLLAGCHSQPPMLTGSEGGMLPGMERPGSTLTSAQAAKLNAPINMVKTTDERLPDGRIHRVQMLGGVLFSEAWYSSTGVAQRIVYYGEGGVPLSVYEYTPDGRISRMTTVYPGTRQVQRLDEYNEDGNVVRFAEYWPSGRPRIISEAQVETPLGPVWRVREWYENGQAKSVTTRNADNRLQGRETTWNAAGEVTSDADYEAGTLTVDYMKKAPVLNNPDGF
jgi:hypothetical protein